MSPHAGEHVGVELDDELLGAMSYCLWIYVCLCNLRPVLDTSNDEHLFLNTDGHEVTNVTELIRMVWQTEGFGHYMSLNFMRKLYSTASLSMDNVLRAVINRYLLLSICNCVQFTPMPCNYNLYIDILVSRKLNHSEQVAQKSYDMSCPDVAINARNAMDSLRQIGK